MDLYTIEGRLLSRNTYTSELILIDMNDLNDGMYILQIKDNAGRLISTEKIIKE